MASNPFKARLRLTEANVIIDLHGELDVFGRDALTSAFEEATKSSPSGILLNFAAVNYINSIGIALIIGLVSKANAAGKRLIACGLSDHYVEIFTITRLVDYLNVYRDEAQALEDALGGA